MIPEIRIQPLNDAPIARSGSYVLYWMTAERRARFNFALERAVELARQHGVGILVFEPLRVGYRYASARFHRFVVEGMRDNAAAFAKAEVTYFPYVERTVDEDKGLLAALAEHALCVVTDHAPMFFLPHLLEAGRRAVKVRMEAVDGRGILPLDEAARHFPTAYAFRRHMQKHVARHLLAPPREDPLRHHGLPLVEIPRTVRERWRPLSAHELDHPEALIASLPLDQAVAAVPFIPGGALAAKSLLLGFVDTGIGRYADDRSHPDVEVASGLSPHLHFGHISPFEIFLDVARREGFTPDQLNLKAAGSREGFWNMGAGPDAFLDQLITWRELGAHTAAFLPRHDRFESLPEWAQETLLTHARDVREHVYRLDELEQARTHDPIWNAAQRQLVVEGRIHNALRMLWGKKILQWTKTPEEALDVMLLLNDKYALDGRDPNSVSGIMWVLGRYDRPWGPERPVFGKIRYMTSEQSKRKWKMNAYLARFGPTTTGQLTLAV